MHHFTHRFRIGNFGHFGFEGERSRAARRAPCAGIDTIRVTQAHPRLPPGVVHPLASRLATAMRTMRETGPRMCRVDTRAFGNRDLHRRALHRRALHRRALHRRGLHRRGIPHRAILRGIPLHRSSPSLHAFLACLPRMPSSHAFLACRAVTPTHQPTRKSTHERLSPKPTSASSRLASHAPAQPVDATHRRNPSAQTVGATRDRHATAPVIPLAIRVLKKPNAGGPLFGVC